MLLPFFPVASVRNRNTRAVARKNVIMPPPNTNADQRTLSYRGPNIWNTIPTEFQCNDNYDGFIAGYHDFVVTTFTAGKIKTSPPRSDEM